MRTPRIDAISRIARSNAATNARRSAAERSARGFISTMCDTMSEPQPAVHGVLEQAGVFMGDVSGELQALGGRHNGPQARLALQRIVRERRQRIDPGGAKCGERAPHVN